MLLLCRSNCSGLDVPAVHFAGDEFLEHQAVAAVGEESFADKLRADLQKMDVDIANLVTIKGAESGIAHIHVNQSSQNSISVVGGANMTWSDEGLGADVFDSCKVALFQLETPIPATLAAMRAAKAAGATMILDPASNAEGHMEAMIAEADTHPQALLLKMSV